MPRSSAARSSAAPPIGPPSGKHKRLNFWVVVGAPALLFLLIAFVAPMVAVVLKSFDSPTPGAFYLSLLQEPIYQRQLVRTVVVSLAVTLLCIVVGYPYAYVMARSGPRLSRFLMALLMVSFWTSLLVRTFAWGVILNDTGLINTLLLDAGIIDQPLHLIRNLFGVMVGMVHVQAPLFILTAYAQIRGLNPELEVAAQSLGARPLVAFWKVTFPLSLPGIAAGSVLVFVLNLGFYLTPQLLGGTGDVMIAQSIVLEVQRYLEPGMGAALGVALIVLVLLALGIASRFVGIGKILGINGEDEK